MIEEKIFPDEKIRTTSYQKKNPFRKDLAQIIADRNYRRASRAINAEYKPIEVTKPRRGKVQQNNLFGSSSKGRTVTYYKRVNRYTSSSKAGGLSPKQKLQGVVRNKVEVMIKIESAKAKGGKGGQTITTASHLATAMEYAARDGKYSHKQTDEPVQLYDQDGNPLSVADIKALSKVWAFEEGADEQSENRIAKRMIISMPGREEDHAFESALKLWLKEQLYNKGFEYVFAIHKDTDNTHAHVIIKAHTKDRLIEHDGEIVNTKANVLFSPKKPELQFMRQRFATLFNQFSKTIEATATMRAPRGVDYTTGTFLDENGNKKIKGKDISQYYAQSNKRNLLVAKRRAYMILEQQGVKLTSEYHEAKHHEYKDKKASDVEKFLDQKTLESRGFIIKGFNEIANEYQKRAAIELKRKKSYEAQGDLAQAQLCDAEAKQLLKDSQLIRAHISKLSGKKRNTSDDLYAKDLASRTLEQAKELQKQKAK